MVDPEGLLGAIYEASLDDGCWVALLPTLARAFGADSAAFVSAHPLESTPATWHNLPDDVVVAYLRDLPEVDLWFHQLLKRDLSRIDVYRGADLVTPGAMRRTRFHADYLRHCEIEHMMGALHIDAKGRTAGFSLYRDGDRPFEDVELEALRRIRPHLDRVLEMRSTLATARIDGSLAALSALRTPVLFFDAQAAVVAQTRGATEALARWPDLRIQGARLASPLRNLRLDVENAVRAVAGGAPTSAVRLAGTAPEGLGLRVLRLPAGLPVPPTARAMGRLVEEGRPHVVGIDELQALYGLTPAEAAVAADLANGRTPTGIAVARGNTIATVRTHLKGAFAKTGTATQADLVRLVLGGFAD